MPTSLRTAPRQDDIDADALALKEPRRAKTARTKLTPVELAAQWGKAPSTIIDLIRGGELPAIDVSVRRGRPRFLIDLADIAVFEERRAVRPPEPRNRRRHRSRTEPQGMKYF